MTGALKIPAGADNLDGGDRHHFNHTHVMLLFVKLWGNSGPEPQKELIFLMPV